MGLGAAGVTAEIWLAPSAKKVVRELEASVSQKYSCITYVFIYMHVCKKVVRELEARVSKKSSCLVVEIL